MRPGLRRRLLLWLTIICCGGAIGFVYGYTISLITGASDVRALSWSIARAGALVTAFSGAFELFYYRDPAGAWLRRKPFLVAFLSRLAIHAALLVLAVLVNRGLNLLFFTPVYLASANPWAILRDLVFAFAVIGFFALLLEFRSLIGPRTFNTIVLGRYHRPCRERRIFLIVDLKDSARLAAEIGDAGYQALLARVFFDFDEIVVDHGGEVHAYVGDQMIATWPFATSRQNRRAVLATLAMQDRIARSAAAYRREFGIAPGMRAALHGGEVVAGEYGSSKRQISYFGDVINAAARMEAVAKSLGCDFAVSKTLLEQIELPAGIAVTDHGEQVLRGTRQPLAICGLARANQGGARASGSA